jgi:hypothetical protein
MIKPLLLWLGSVCVALLWGCAVPGTSGAHLYTPPSVAHEPTAFLVGSSEIGPGLFVVRYVAFPFAVDGLRVQNANSNWSIPVPLTPGRHRITAEFNFPSYYARTDLDIDARAGDDYVIKYATDAASGKTFCEFWIDDQKTGKTLTPVVRERLEKK